MLRCVPGVFRGSFSVAGAALGRSVCIVCRLQAFVLRVPACLGARFAMGRSVCRLRRRRAFALRRVPGLLLRGLALGQSDCSLCRRWAFVLRCVPGVLRGLFCVAGGSNWAVGLWSVAGGRLCYGVPVPGPVLPGRGSTWAVSL